MFGFFKKKPAPVPEPAKPVERVSDDSIITLRQGIDRKKANMQKLRETLNGCLPPEERTAEDGTDNLAKLAIAFNRSRG